MGNYHFKCKNCGATKFKIENENEYVCEYCGYREIDTSINNKSKEEIEKLQQSIEEIKTKQKEHEKNFEKKEQRSVVEKIFNSKLIMLIICVFAGAWGVHKFVEGKIGMGLLYFFTFGLMGIGVFFDAINYLVKYIKGFRE